MLTEVCSGSTFRRDHHVLEFLKIESFTRHYVHGMIQHLTRSIGILDLIP